MPEVAGPAFRQMREEDLARPEVSEFYCGEESWAEEVADFLRSGEAWKKHAPPKSMTLLFCTEGGEGEIIGFANIVKRKVGYPEFQGEQRIPCLLITHTAVSSNYQGQGFFRRMIRDLAKLAIIDELDGIYLLVDERNIGAIAIYSSLGFKFFEHAEPFADQESGNRYLRMILALR